MSKSVKITITEDIKVDHSLQYVPRLVVDEKTGSK